MKAWGMTGRIMAGLALASALLTSAGCAVFKQGASMTPYSDKELENFYRRSKDPRMFFITVYRGTNNMPVFADTFRLHSGQVASLSMGGRSPAPAVIAGRMDNGRAFRGLLDTSSKECWTGLDFARDYDMVPLGPTAFTAKPTHISDDVSGYLCIAPSMRFEDLRVESGLFFARGMHGGIWPLTRSPDAGNAEAVLGMAFLRRFAFVQFDFENRIVILSATTEYRASEEGSLASIPILPGEDSLKVQINISGHKVAAILDSAGEYELAVPNPPEGPISSISIGDLVIPRVKAISILTGGFGPGETPRVGLGILSKYRITLDNRRQMIHFERPGASREAWWSF